MELLSAKFIPIGLFLDSHSFLSITVMALKADCCPYGPEMLLRSFVQGAGTRVRPEIVVNKDHGLDWMRPIASTHIAFLFCSVLFLITQGWTDAPVPCPRDGTGFHVDSLCVLGAE